MDGKGKESMSAVEACDASTAERDGSVAGEDGADPSASVGSAWRTGGASYSRALSSSVRKIMTTRPRMPAIRSHLLGGGHADAPISVSMPEKDAALFERFVAAVTSRDKDEMITIVTQHPQVMQLQDDEERSALHLVCALAPNYYFADVISIMVQSDSLSPARMDTLGQTPLHILCQNETVTCQALTTLLTALPACAAVSDKRANLALHYLCKNKLCDLAMVQRATDDDVHCMANEDGQTPLHCLAMTLTMDKKAALLSLLAMYPDAVKAVDNGGRTVLHWICESESVDMELVASVMDVCDELVKLADAHSDLPLHLLAANRWVTSDVLKKLLHAHPNTIYDRTENDLTALHGLCGNDSINSDLLSEFLIHDKEMKAVALQDKVSYRFAINVSLCQKLSRTFISARLTRMLQFGANPLHVLCMNEAITVKRMREVLLSSSDDSFTQDTHGRSPLHYLCANRSVTRELVWLFIERAHSLLRDVDEDGKTPLHHICANKSVDSSTLETLFDAFPGAALLADKELRLPVQYLVDNPSSPPEMTVLLISGPGSYRRRYDLLGVTQSHAVSFVQNKELVYLQTNFAMDNNSSRKVRIKFFSSARARDHEQKILARLTTAARHKQPEGDECLESSDYAIAFYEDFDDAKKRVVIRDANTVPPEDQIGDASVTLQFGLVLEAASYTLESLDTEHVDDLEVASAMITDIGDCLAFWHGRAGIIHGNVTLGSVGYIAGRGLRLFDFHTSRECHEPMPVDINALFLPNCPPEAATALLGNECFTPTMRSDVWQFGCVIFQLATGHSLLSTLAPWSQSLGPTQLLHLISSLTDKVLQCMIDQVDSRFRGLLQSVLVVSPAQRWTMDRVMQLDSCHVDGEIPPQGTKASLHALSTRLQQKSDEETSATEYQRSAKHAHDQLAFARSEQCVMRSQLLAMKSQLRERDEECELLRQHAKQLQFQLERANTQKADAQQEVHVLARTHQSMSHQLHTTMQMLISLVPLAKKVYGASADEFLSRMLAESAGAESSTLSTIDIGGSGVGGIRSAGTRRPGVTRRNSALQAVKQQLQRSMFAHGCLHTWAHSTPPYVASNAHHRGDHDSHGFSSKYTADSVDAKDNQVAKEYDHEAKRKAKSTSDTPEDDDEDRAIVTDNQRDHTHHPLGPFMQDCFLLESESESDDDQVEGAVAALT